MGKIIISRVTRSDSELIWEWRNDIQTRLMSLQSDPITFNEHTIWLDKAIKSNNVHFYITKIDNCPLGISRFDLLNYKSNSYQININLSPFFRGKNLSKSHLKCSLEKLHEEIPGNKEIIANVKKENIKSNSLFGNSGFNIIKENKLIYTYCYLLRKEK